MAVVCDTPAAHKIGGFGSHSATYFCIRCWIKLENKGTAAAFEKGGEFIVTAEKLINLVPSIAFRPRSNAEQRKLGQEYLMKHAHTVFVTTFSTRFTQLSRLPYFDLV